MIFLSAPTKQPNLRGTLGAIVPQYKCSTTMCYSNDGRGVGQGTDGLFRELQSSINLFSRPANFSPIKVDGFIGNSTLVAMTKVANYLRQYAPSLKNSIEALSLSATSKEKAAQLAQVNVDNLSIAIKALGISASPSAPTTSEPYIPSPPPYTPVPDSQVPNPSTLPEPVYTTTTEITEAPKWPLYVGGAALAAGAMYLVWVLVSSGKKKSNSSKSRYPRELQFNRG